MKLSVAHSRNVTNRLGVLEQHTYKAPIGYLIWTKKNLHIKFVNETLRMFWYKHAIEMRSGKSDSNAYLTAHIDCHCVLVRFVNKCIYPDKVVYGSCITFGHMHSFFPSSNVCFRYWNALALLLSIMKLANDWDKISRLCIAACLNAFIFFINL